jgi:copper chaperone CopZ
MVKLHANDIQCSHCTGRIEKALKKANINAEISLQNKTIEIEDAFKSKVLEILDDLGFPVKEI